MLALAAAVLWMCLPMTTVAVAEGETTTAAVMQRYADVLLGKEAYLVYETDENGVSTENGTFVTGDVSEWNGYRFETAMTYGRFCEVDLDADGTAEIVLEVLDTEGYPFGYKVLRWDQQSVYGFEFFVRAMQTITASGLVAYSSGAADNGWYRLSFSEGTCETADVCWMESEWDDAIGMLNVAYFVGGNEVTEDEYQAFEAQIESEERPVWLDLTEENVNAMVAQYQ